MSSSDSDSEDENIALLREAADTTLISDAMFNKTRTDDEGQPTTEFPTSTDVNKTAPPSQRHLEFEEHNTDLKVTESMRNFVYKKMSNIINETIEFVDIDTSNPVKKKTNITTVVKLLKDTDPIDLDADQKYERTVQVKPDIRKRQIEADNLSNDEKIRAASINIVQLNESIGGWNHRPLKENKFFKYREKKGNLYLIEPENEFTKLRKKNNWSETKIHNFKHKYKTKPYALSK